MRKVFRGKDCITSLGARLLSPIKPAQALRTLSRTLTEIAHDMMVLAGKVPVSAVAVISSLAPYV